MTEEQESKRRTEEFANTTALFVEHLGVEEVIAQLLSVEGYASLEQIAYAEDNTLSAIEGFNAELVEELKNRAITYLEKQNDDIIEGLESLGVEQELLDTLELPPEYILKLAEFGVKTIEDLGEVTVSEFRSIVPDSVISSENIEALLNYAKEQSQKGEQE
jgi:N utilization substance protein A